MRSDRCTCIVLLRFDLALPDTDYCRLRDTFRGYKLGKAYSAGLATSIEIFLLATDFVIQTGNINGSHYGICCFFCRIKPAELRITDYDGESYSGKSRPGAGQHLWARIVGIRLGTNTAVRKIKSSSLQAAGVLLWFSITQLPDYPITKFSERQYCLHSSNKQILGIVGTASSISIRQSSILHSLVDLLRQQFANFGAELS